MTTAQDLARDYLAIWNEVEPDRRREMIERTWSADATYTDPMFEAAGHDGIDALVAGFQHQFPGVIFRQIRETESHHDRARFSWEVVTATGNVAAAGTDIVVIRSGKLQTVTGFFDRAPVLDSV
jgi:hypothetical protein